MNVPGERPSEKRTVQALRFIRPLQPERLQTLTELTTDSLDNS